MVLARLQPSPASRPASTPYLYSFEAVARKVLTMRDVSVCDRGLSRRKLFDLLSLANLGAVCLEYSIYVAYTMGKLHIRRLSRR